MSTRNVLYAKLEVPRIPICRFGPDTTDTIDVERSKKALTFLQGHDVVDRFFEVSCRGSLLESGRYGVKTDSWEFAGIVLTCDAKGSRVGQKRRFSYSALSEQKKCIFKKLRQVCRQSRV